MGTYQSKYTGAEIDALLDVVSEGGGSSYKETELLSGPVSYKQGGSSATTIGEDLSLLDDISKYDEIVFLCACNSGSDVSAKMHPSEIRFLTSNIVYNNSDSQIWDGSRFTLYNLSDINRFLGGWFKSGTSLRIHITFSNASPIDGHFKIVSIKGIKY